MSEAFALTEDQELFRREWRRLFEEKFTERAAEIDRTGEFPWDNLKVLAEAGLTGINIPEAYGGAEADSITHTRLGSSADSLTRYSRQPGLSSKSLPDSSKISTTRWRWPGFAVSRLSSTWDMRRTLPFLDTERN